MRTRPPSATASIGAVIVAGLVIAVPMIDWKEVVQAVKSARAQPTISINSPLRAVARDYLAGEKLRLSLENIQTDKVYWLIDEEHVVPGSIQVEYAFPYDTSLSIGLTKSRRVDAFFKVGDEYHAVTQRVQISNIKWNTAALIVGDTIRFTAAHQLSGGWKLSNVSLASYGYGFFATQPAVLTGQHDYPVLTGRRDHQFSRSLFSEYTFQLSPSDSVPDYISARYTNLVSKQDLILVQRLQNTLSLNFPD